MMCQEKNGVFGGLFRAGGTGTGVFGLFRGNPYRLPAVQNERKSLPDGSAGVKDGCPAGARRILFGEMRSDTI
jgi:hypothetical protein